MNNVQPGARVWICDVSLPDYGRCGTVTKTVNMYASDDIFTVQVALDDAASAVAVFYPNEVEVLAERSVGW